MKSMLNQIFRQEIHFVGAKRDSLNMARKIKFYVGKFLQRKLFSSLILFYFVYFLYCVLSNNLL